MSLTKRHVADLAASAAVPFIAVWLYEAANWISMTSQGHPATFTVSGLLPLGVAASSAGGISPLTKVLQVALALSFIYPFVPLFGRAQLPVARTLVVSTAGVFVASAYWEMLPAAYALPETVHTVVFLAGASAISFATLWALDNPRRLRPSMVFRALRLLVGPGLGRHSPEGGSAPTRGLPNPS